MVGNMVVECRMRRMEGVVMIEIVMRGSMCFRKSFAVGMRL